MLKMTPLIVVSVTDRSVACIIVRIISDAEEAVISSHPELTL